MKEYTDSIDARLTGRHKKCVKFCGDLKDKKILNIGCYNGWFEKLAIENDCAEIIGADKNENNLLNAKFQVRKKNVKFLKVSALGLAQFEANYFDLITMFDVLEHLPRNTEERCLSRVRRVLKKNGDLIISTPNESFCSKILDPAWYFGHSHYSKENIGGILSKAGFKVEKIDYGGGSYELFSMILLYIFKWIFRREIPFKSWFEKKRGKEYFNNRAFVTLFIKAVKA